MVDNHLPKRVTEYRIKEIINNLNQVGYCYKLSTDIDNEYKFINPIYVLTYTIAKYVNGSVLINDHHNGNWECGLYENEEYKQELIKKYGL